MTDEELGPLTDEQLVESLRACHNSIPQPWRTSFYSLAADRIEELAGYKSAYEDVCVAEHRLRAELAVEVANADRLEAALVAVMAADSVGGPDSFDEWSDAMDATEPMVAAALAAHRALRAPSTEAKG